MRIKGRKQDEVEVAPCRIGQSEKVIHDETHQSSSTRPTNAAVAYSARPQRTRAKAMLPVE